MRRAPDADRQRDDLGADTEPRSHLLKAAQGEGGPAWADAAIAGALEGHPATVARVRRAYVEGGLAAALERKAPDRVFERRLDGAQEARLQLNTHSPASPYEVFPPAEAKRIAEQLEIHHTPTHGSWLNMAELELGVLQRQCLGRRLADRPTMEREVAAWTAACNAATRTIDWRFTTEDARINLRRLSPAVQE